jgi:hypothetical protein
MSTLILPALPGLTWPIKKTTMWKTRVQESVSGKRTIIRDWSYPRYSWELPFSMLRQAGASEQMTSYRGLTYVEYSSLQGFFNTLGGRGDTFLYQDVDDNSATNQFIATGDGVTTVFQMQASFGGFYMPITAPQTITQLRVNGVPQTPGAAYDYSLWGGNFAISNTASGMPGGGIAFVATPPAGAQIYWDGSYYFPCQFDDDTMNFQKFTAAFYECKSVKFSSFK